MSESSPEIISGQGEIIIAPARISRDPGGMENLTIPEALGRACRACRAERGLSQAQLVVAAKAAGHEINAAGLSSMERGEPWPARGFAAVAAGLAIAGGELLEAATRIQAQAQARGK